MVAGALRMELAQLVVFARPPKTGFVKTRLAGVLGEAGAAELYEAFAEDTVRLCERVRAAGRVDVVLWSAGVPDAAVSDWARRLGTSPVVQPEGDLGSRMSFAFEEGLRKYERVLIVGTDAPSMPAELIARAFDSLQDADLTLGPANDGGYYAIGARHGARPSFDAVRWSSETALQDTLAANPALEIAMLPPWYDIDEPDDLELLRAHLSLDPAAAPATAQRLARLDRAQR